jgi:hypothetical protein
MARLSFYSYFSYKPNSPRTLIVLVYNSQWKPIKLPAEAFGSGPCVIEPNSYEVAKGIIIEAMM